MSGYKKFIHTERLYEIFNPLDSGNTVDGSLSGTFQTNILMINQQGEINQLIHLAEFELKHGDKLPMDYDLRRTIYENVTPLYGTNIRHDLLKDLRISGGAPALKARRAIRLPTVSEAREASQHTINTELVFSAEV